MTSPKSKRHPHIWMSCGLSLLFFISLLYIALPYRVFPCDEIDYQNRINELRFLLDMNMPGEFFSSILHERLAVYLMAVLGMQYVTSLFPVGPMAHFPVISAIGHGVTLFFLFLIIHRTTKSLPASLAGGLLFATSGWPMTYVFEPLHIAFSTPFILAGLYILLTVEPLEDGGWRKVVIAASFASVSQWISSSALAMLAVLTTIAALLFMSKGFYRAAIRLFLVWCGTLFAMVSVYFLLAGQAYFIHARANLNSKHWTMAASYFDVLPRIKPLNFLRILYLYSPMLTTLLAAAAGLAIYAILSRRKQWLGETGLRVAFILLLGISLHAAMMDIMPVTKLGRLHFPYLPMVIAIVAIVGHWALLRLRAKSEGYGRMGIAVAAVLICITMYQGIAVAHETVRVRTAAPEYIKHKMPDIPLFVLAEDDNAQFITPWLSEFKIGVISASDLLSYLNRKDRLADTRFAVILGPTGKDSAIGLSSLPGKDFYFDYSNIPHVILPWYYSFYPPFTVEEEVNQALYQEGRIPDYRTPESSLKILLF